MKIKKLINYLCLSGILCVIFYVLHDIIGALNYPGYNWMSQAVSDLTASDSPSFVVAHGYSAIYGIFSCLCCALLCVIIGNKKSKALRLGVYLFAIMTFISAIGYSLFPLSSAGYDGTIGSFIHVYVITILVVLLSIVSLVLISIGSFKENHKVLGILSIVCLTLMFIGAVGSANVPRKVFGIFERFSTYSAVLFTGILGIYGCFILDE